MKTLLSLIALLLLSLFVLGQTATTTTQQDTGAKQDVKTAGHATKRAAKKGAHKVKRTTKKGIHKSAHATRKGAGKVEDKTRTAPPE